MSTSNTPRLCGGTFFILLLQVRIPRRKSLENYAGKSDSFTDPDMLEELIRVMDPDYIEPSKSTFKSNTSSYKACNILKGACLPFDDIAITKAFDAQIKNHYSIPLRAMEAFISSFISIESKSKRTWLVKALLELIETDNSIKEDALFYIIEDGKTVTKNNIRSLTDICLQSFILGIWHFVVINRPDNTIGQNTFLQWHQAPKIKGQQYKFISNIGDDIIRDIRIKMLDLDNVDAEPEPEVTVEDDYTHASTNQEGFNDSTTKNTVHQIINNPTVVNQYGQKNIHIEYVDKLNF